MNTTEVRITLGPSAFVTATIVAVVLGNSLMYAAMAFRTPTQPPTTHQGPP